MKPLLSNDKDALKASTDIQQRSKDALSRIQHDLEETQQTGAMTLDDLDAQRRKMDGVDHQADRLHDQLDETAYLQSKLGSWFGGKRKKKNSNSTSNSSNKDRESPEQAKNDLIDSSNTNANSKNKKSGKWKFGRSSKKSSVHEDPTISVTIGSLDKETALYRGEHKDEMRALAQGDHEIDAQMDMIGNQLGNLLTMAQEIGSETKHQQQRIERVDNRVADAQERQRKANKKTKKFLSR
ncbi:expressed unknown protein [Seminavis robusta]|uniref:t-SNARE coiled-coil homology domain-containing protein n=1 Tax=Seminavis robusta TaxID=568900 RepID=A0A9N8D6U4_9STRA|nr:expressed unknown protein [Seminavis robusta]|eukprot:Sro3_g002660.1 n/a (239) ;mRNA; f:212704-213420